MGYQFETREELSAWFDSLVHNYTKMNELPHETVARMTGWGDPDYDEWLKNFWADFLLTLSNKVRAVGQME